MLWPFLRAAAHTEVLRIAGPVLDNMPPFVANVLLPGLGTVVSVPIQGVAAAIKLYEQGGARRRCQSHVLAAASTARLECVCGGTHVYVLAWPFRQRVLHSLFFLVFQSEFVSPSSQNLSHHRSTAWTCSGHTPLAS